MIVEWLWAAMFAGLVVASAVGLKLTTRVREPESALAHARNVFIAGVVMASLGALWIVAVMA